MTALALDFAPEDSGPELTPAGLKLMSLYGALQGVEWAVVEALVTVAGPAPLGNPALHDQLLKLQLGLVKYQGICLNAAFPKEKP